jgi:hypothetical protein
MNRGGEARFLLYTNESFCVENCQYWKVFGNWIGKTIPPNNAKLSQNYLLNNFIPLVFLPQCGNCGAARAWGVRGKRDLS